MTEGLSQVMPFGVTRDGQSVQRITLQNDTLRVAVLTRGAVVQDVRLTGVPYSLTLGSDTLADYEGPMRYHGALIGPVVNRISGATATIAGVRRQFEANQDNRLTLHSGAAGTQHKLWDMVALTADSLTLALHLADGDGGFPGNRQITACFTLTAPATLRLVVTARTDAPTLINFANHSYWNLDGTPTWAGHSLQLAADRYLPTDADDCPTGEISPTAASAFDFANPRRITPGQPPLDHCFCLNDARRPLQDVAWLQGNSGLRMTLATTEPGLQVYDGRDARRPGHGAHEGLAFEAQGWPDAPKHAGFPGITCMPGQTCRQETEWRISRG